MVGGLKRGGWGKGGGGDIADTDVLCQTGSGLASAGLSGSPVCRDNRQKLLEGIFRLSKFSFQHQLKIGFQNLSLGERGFNELGCMIFNFACFRLSFFLLDSP